VTEAIILN